MVEKKIEKLIKQLYRRQDISSFNYLLTSHVWRQDHNGNYY